MDFWDSLISLKVDLQGKDVIIAGDFNTTKSSSEKRGRSIVRDPFGEKLEDLAAELDLLPHDQKLEIHLEQQASWTRAHCRKIRPFPGKYLLPTK